jgi:CRISPR/Cas system-associated endonuclease/helicase Cas3
MLPVPSPRIYCSINAHLAAFLQWLASGFEKLCTDHGPDGHHLEYCLSSLDGSKPFLRAVYTRYLLTVLFFVRFYGSIKISPSKSLSDPLIIIEYSKSESSKSESSKK